MQDREFLALPDWSAVPGNSAEDCRLLNQRLAYFGAVLFWLSFAFFLFNFVVLGALQGSVLTHLTSPAELLHAAAIAIFGLTWLACRSGRRPAEQLNLIDVGTLVGSISLFAWKGVLEHGGFLQATVTVMTSLAVIVTHAIMVPATARRAFGVSLLAALPATIAAYFICLQMAEQDPSVGFWKVVFATAYIGLWSALTVAVATLAARVIYGLRERAREAREIGQYTLEARLGAGGMGVVYRARHSLLKRPTAIKVLPLARSGERSIKRFEREVQLTSSLTHPNTVAVYDFGRTPDGLFYYVMEYLDGITLEDLVRHGGPLPPARVVYLLAQLCGALVEAHSIGLVHRDIKPANLMLCVRGLVSDHLKVLDFGLVKEPEGQGDPSATDASSLIGTPLYMAPEAVLDPRSVGAAADLYALGAVAYFLLVGEPVFSGASSMEICLKQVHEPPAAPSSRATQPVPSALDELVLACLHKQPAGRPASAAALRARLLELEATLAWSQRDAEAWWQSHSRQVLEATRAQQSTPRPDAGPQTLAIDWAARHAPTALA
jgi:eukaryotic-like serine/threonine-protein kinase